jgi:hypothetical protein
MEVVARLIVSSISYYEYANLPNKKDLQASPLNPSPAEAKLA